MPNSNNNNNTNNNNNNNVVLSNDGLNSPNINPYTNANTFYHQPMQQYPLQPQNLQDPTSTTSSSIYGNDEQPNVNIDTANKCICKSKVNKIPRPRNAFILFRQKYHQTVLDEGTIIRTNPEVSRELGRRWRNLSPQEKDHWNNLAEEEKKNHAKKYPGYRYTPRRNGKNKNCPVCKDKPVIKNTTSGSSKSASFSGPSMTASTITSSGLAGIGVNVGGEIQGLPQDQYHQIIKQQQHHQIQAQSVVASMSLNNNANNTNNNGTPITYSANNNAYQSYIISPNPYQQQQQQQHQYGNPNTSQPNSANSQLHFYEPEKLSPGSLQQQQQQQQGQHHGSVSESVVSLPHPPPQQFYMSGNYSTLPPTNNQLQQQQQQQMPLQHPAGTGNEYINGYDSRFTFNGGIPPPSGQIQQQQPPPQQQQSQQQQQPPNQQSQQHYDGFNGIPQPPQ
ncbi:RFG1 Repressor of filamentous growth 1 [Candida maltosa Xu316]